MRIKLLAATIAIGGMLMAGCSDDDDNVRVEDNFQTAFSNKYPDAERVSWERKVNHYVADFWRPDMKAEAEAWFDANATWQLTETDITFEALPAAVRSAFEAGEYGTWRIDDVDMLERTGMETVYVIEVEKGAEEYDLFFAPDGTLLKAVLDREGNNDSSEYLPSELPATITAFISSTYPSARILEIEREKGKIEVDILDGTVYRELVFNPDGEWQYTSTDMRVGEVPQQVMDAFEASEYSSYMIDDVDLINTPAGDYYLFELENEPGDIYIKITPEGNVSKA